MPYIDIDADLFEKQMNKYVKMVKTRFLGRPPSPARDGTRTKPKKQEKREKQEKQEKQ